MSDPRLQYTIFVLIIGLIQLAMCIWWLWSTRHPASRWATAIAAILPALSVWRLVWVF